MEFLFGFFTTVFGIITAVCMLRVDFFDRQVSANYYIFEEKAGIYVIHMNIFPAKRPANIYGIRAENALIGPVKWIEDEHFTQHHDFSVMPFLQELPLNLSLLPEHADPESKPIFFCLTSLNKSLNNSRERFKVSLISSKFRFMPKYTIEIDTNRDN